MWFSRLCIVDQVDVSHGFIARGLYYPQAEWQTKTKQKHYGYTTEPKYVEVSEEKSEAIERAETEAAIEPAETEAGITVCSVGTTPLYFPGRSS